MAFPEFIDFQNKKWHVVGKVSGEKVDNHANLKKHWACVLVLKNNQNIFFMLNEVIDVEFEEL